jgi:hypothetical protein
MKASARIFYLIALLLPLAFTAQAINAQAIPEGARVNKDKCLGYDLDYKKYPKPVIAKIQADMYQLYHQEVEWQKDAGRTGKPLNDGILGPITWSWMQRFCKSFALDTTADVVAAFPVRASAIAIFSEKFNADAVTLISVPFAQWAATHITACELDTSKTLAAGNDTELQALLRCYHQPAPKPEVKPEAKQAPVIASIIPYSLYVLRADDFEAMAAKVSAASAADKVISQIAGIEFPDRPTAIAEIDSLLTSLSPQEAKAISAKISVKLTQMRRYDISDQVLNNLNQQGISDALFTNLKNLPEKRFADKKNFDTAVNAAIKNSLVDNSRSTAHASRASTDDGSSNAQTSSISVVVDPAPNPDKLLLQIQLASQQDYVELSKADADTLTGHKKQFAAVVIKLLHTLQDVEYPTADLLQRAIKSKILKASGICKLDKSNTVDNQLGNLDDEEAKVLSTEIKRYLSINDQDAIKYCNEDHEKALDNYYNDELHNTLEQLYTEPMPNYAGKPILWNGGGEGCGCVPKEIQTMAYGIYPYWKIGASPQEFDFSTFSRVAYFGLTATDSGKLMQINAGAGTSTLLNDNSDAAKAFLREARRYGSKVDWLIEKEFSLSPTLNDEASLNEFFDNLHKQIVSFLTTPLDDAESRLRRLSSLGLAGHPTNGDGVTLYFKNYPDTPLARDSFATFFKELKSELVNTDARHNRFHTVKQNTYVNIMVTQTDFLKAGAVFSNNHIDLISGVSEFSDDNLSIPEIQERVKTMVLLLLEDPYYSALDEIYAVTTSTDRTIIAPLMFTDYAGMSAANNNTSAHQIDERQKRLAYIHESFGGGAFWPMIEYRNASDGKDYTTVNAYIGKHFSPGYTESLWNETLCGYRWTLIAIMNIWLLLALAYLIIIFYVYPHCCKKLPVYIRWLQHPLTVVIVLLPPIVLWVYLIVVDPVFNFINLTSLIGLVVLALAVWAGIDAIKELKELKPNRNLLQYQKNMAVPTRTITAPEQVDEMDDTDVIEGNK